MCHVEDRLKLQFGAFCYLVFYTVVFLTLICVCRGQYKVTGLSQPVVAAVGDDIILPCLLQPAEDASDMSVEWTRPDLDPRFVHVWHRRVEQLLLKHQSYTERTSLFISELKHGNISLKLSTVKLSDEGKYRCFIPELNRDSTVQLFVGVFSSPAVTKADKNTSISGLVLQCESKGWYPEPELLWLDSEGNLLSAGPTETVRGPDDLYTVSSTVTVEKRHSNNITCRVQQRNINQIRETHIHVPDFVFPDQSIFSSSSGSYVPFIIGLIVVVIVVFILVAVLLVWKIRKNKLENKKNDEDEETQRVREDKCRSDSENEFLMKIRTESEHVTAETEENQNVMETQTRNNLHTQKKETTDFKASETEDPCLMEEEKHRTIERETLSDPDMEKLKKHLKTKERDERLYGQKLSRLMKQRTGKEKQINEIRKQLEEVDRQREDTERTLQSVNRKEETMETDTERRDSQGEKELYDTKNDLERKKEDLQKHLNKTKTWMERIENDINVVTRQKMETTNEKEEIVKKIELKKQKNKNVKTTSAD